MTVSADIAEADIAKVTVGQKANVTFPADTSLKATAVVTSIAPTATASNSVVTYPTTITLDAIPAGLRLGQTANVAIATASSSADALYVPAAAITTANGKSTVKVVKNGKTSTVTVTTGIVGDTGTEIKTGLTEGETVVLGTVAPTTTTGTTGTGGAGGAAGGAGGAGGGFGGGAGGGGGGFGGGGARPGGTTGGN
jgi:macrolide-specific efflux system membrane fusion protein